MWRLFPVEERLKDLSPEDYFRDLSGELAGTPGYAAPEIMTGRHHHSYEADIFSLGVIVYIMLFGTVCSLHLFLESLLMQVPTDALLY